LDELFVADRALFDGEFARLGYDDASRVLNVFLSISEQIVVHRAHLWCVPEFEKNFFHAQIVVDTPPMSRSNANIQNVAQYLARMHDDGFAHLYRH
jgi:hypothetical protein